EQAFTTSKSRQIMQSHDANAGTARTVKHPQSSDWMSFLYGECPPERRRELDTHLATCAVCASQVQTWRSSMNALDEWPLPTKRHVRRQWIRTLKWAAAAAVVLAVGIGIGRQSSNARAEVAALKNSIAELTVVVEREHNFNISNSLAMA